MGLNDLDIGESGNRTFAECFYVSTLCVSRLRRVRKGVLESVVIVLHSEWSNGLGFGNSHHLFACRYLPKGGHFRGKAASKISLARLE
jgi:hypothetical protein